MHRSPLTPIAWLIPVLPVAVFLLYALTVPGLLRGEQAGVYATAAALVDRGTFAIDGALAALAPAPAAADDPPGAYPRVAYFAGHHYLAMPPGLPALAVPLYLLGSLAAPLLGAEATIGAVALAGPLLAALTMLRLARLTGRHGLPGPVLSLAAVLVGLPLNHARPVALITFMLVALLASWATPPAIALFGGTRRAPAALALGLLGGIPLLLDYSLGALAGALLALYLATLLGRRRDTRSVALILVGAGLPLALLLLWQTALFGAPWHPAFRVAVDPAARSFRSLLLSDPHLPLAVPALLIGAAASLPAGVFRWRRDSGARATVVPGVALAGLALAVVVALALRLASGAVLIPIDWLSPSSLALLGLVAALLATASAVARLPAFGRWRRAAVPAILLIALVGVPVAGRGAAAANDYAPPFATASPTAAPVWTITGGQGTAAEVQLAAGGSATSPWIEARPGLVYAFGADGAGPLRLTFLWEDPARASVGSQIVTFAAGAPRVASFAAPVRAAGLRLRLDAPDGAATVADVRLRLASGVRVEPFPDGNRAALAFSFDWESAMGGLIHSRSAGGEGEWATVGLRADGGPSVAEAEEKGLRMREGARFLADLFARHDIRATFYATGYNLLDGNPTCQKVLGDPVYRNANQANGWGSDWWRTHPWYGDDPCATEAQAPAWYFASETLALAAAGHEIASHTFGHLYVRGVSPAQLREDLDLWNRSARALGLPAARTFAFPWTSSNSLTADFWAVFEQAGMTTLTRLYPRDLRHPYELDRVGGDPNLIVFPDFYLASNAAALDAALARIDITLASRGYHSLWNHPNEAIEQNGQIVWQRVVEYAAARRADGLWIAPVSEVAAYGRDTRQVAVTALPVAGGDYLVVENRSGQRLAGVTLGLPEAGTIAIDGRRVAGGPAGTVTLPPLEPGARVVVLVRR